MGKLGHREFPVVKAYATHVTKHPFFTLSISITVMLFLSVIGFVVRDDLPDLSNARKGMEARGTYMIGSRLSLFQQKNQEVCDGRLSNVATHLTLSYGNGIFPKDNEEENDAWLRTCLLPKPELFLGPTTTTTTTTGRRQLDKEIDPTTNPPYGATDKTCTVSNPWIIDEYPYSNLQLVYTSTEYESLPDYRQNETPISFTATNLQKMCEIDKFITDTYSFELDFELEPPPPRQSCAPRSISNYMQLHFNLTSCR